MNGALVIALSLSCILGASNAMVPDHTKLQTAIRKYLPVAEKEEIFIDGMNLKQFTNFVTTELPHYCDDLYQEYIAGSAGYPEEVGNTQDEYRKDFFENSLLTILEGLHKDVVRLSISTVATATGIVVYCERNKGSAFEKSFDTWRG